jgi:parvulin-like peptidyl-prolyl isomerase
VAFSPALASAVPAKASTPPAPPKAAKGDSDATYAYLVRDGAEVKVPLFDRESAKLPIATVQDDVIRLEDLLGALSATHGSIGKGAMPGKLDFSPLLERMIQVRLLSAEAREMGIDELPEVREAVAGFRSSAGEQILKAKVTSGLKPDRAEVERKYRNAVREWKVKSVLFAGELDAKQLGAKLKEPGKFDAVAKELVASGKAKGGGDGEYLPRNKMLPQVIATLEKLEVGRVSDPIRVQDGFAVLKVEAIRYPDDPKTRAELERASLETRQKKALKTYYDGLVKRWAKVDRALLKSLDYHAEKPGMEALRKDGRTIASFQGGEKPITVADLTKALEAGFFHGFDRAMKEGKVNKQKEEVFDGLLSQRVIPLQVKAEKIEQLPDFERRVAEYEMGVLFSRFLEKAILPRLDLGEAKIKKYYDDHRKEFMYPTFYKVESLAFPSMKEAEEAVKKLRAGTDFKWLNANAENQVKPAARKLAIEGTLAATALPQEIAAVLANAKKGDYRLHAGPESQYYAIHVADVIGATEQPFEEVRETIAQRLQNEEMTAAIKRWADTLRNARPVKVFITRIGS